MTAIHKVLDKQISVGSMTPPSTTDGRFRAPQVNDKVERTLRARSSSSLELPEFGQPWTANGPVAWPDSLIATK